MDAILVDMDTFSVAVRLLLIMLMAVILVACWRVVAKTSVYDHQVVELPDEFMSDPPIREYDEKITGDEKSHGWTQQLGDVRSRP